MVVFEVCQGGKAAGCQSQAKIDEWLENKYLVTIENV